MPAERAAKRRPASYEPYDPADGGFHAYGQITQAEADAADPTGWWALAQKVEALLHSDDFAAHEALWTEYIHASFRGREHLPIRGGDDDGDEDKRRSNARDGTQAKGSVTNNEEQAVVGDREVMEVEDNQDTNSEDEEEVEECVEEDERPDKESLKGELPDEDE